MKLFTLKMKYWVIHSPIKRIKNLRNNCTFIQYGHTAESGLQNIS